MSNEILHLSLDKSARIECKSLSTEAVWGRGRGSEWLLLKLPPESTHSLQSVCCLLLLPLAPSLGIRPSRHHAKLSLLACCSFAFTFTCGLNDAAASASAALNNGASIESGAFYLAPIALILSWCTLPACLLACTLSDQRGREGGGDVCLSWKTFSKCLSLIVCIKTTCQI